MRRGLSIAGLGLLGLATWLWWPRDAGEPRDLAMTGNETAAPAAPIAAASAPDAKAPQTGNEREAVAVPAPETAAEANGPQLRVRLRGLHAQAPWTALLRLDVDGHDEKRLPIEHGDHLLPDANGVVTFALPSWALQMTRGRLRSDNGNYQPLQLTTDKPFDFTQELVVDVQVIAIVNGRVVGPQRVPLPGARVQAFAIRDGAPVDGSLARINTRHDGTFTIAVPPDQPLLLVAVPTIPLDTRSTTIGGGVLDRGVVRSDLLPAALTTRGALGSPQEVGDIVLGTATPITGFVRWSDGTPVANAAVTVVPHGASNGLVIDENNSVGVRAAGSAIPGGTATSSRDGSFSLPAIADGRVDLWLLKIGGCELVGEPLVRKATAGEHVLFEVPRPVRLRVKQRGKPAPLARFEVEGWLPLMANHEGHVDAVLLQALRVRGVHEASRSPWRDVPVDAAGTTIDLEVSRELTPIAIEFDGDFWVRSTSVAWRRADGIESREYLWRDHHSGGFTLFLEPGRYHLTAGPGGDESGSVYLLAVDRDVDVGTAKSELLLPARLGGLFTLSATNSIGLHVAGRCVVLSAAGLDCSAAFLVQGTSGSLVGLPGDVIQGGVNEFTNVLPPGDYELLLDFPEHGAQRTRVTIKPREVTEVRIRLP